MERMITFFYRRFLKNESQGRVLRAQAVRHEGGSLVYSKSWNPEKLREFSYVNLSNTNPNPNQNN